MKTGIARVVILIVVSGCTSGDADRTAETVEVSVPGAVDLPGNCQVFIAGGTNVPTWTAGLPVGCLATDSPQLHHVDGMHLYDSCEMEEWIPGLCEPLPFGSQFCNSERWTVICQRDTDCPAGARCSWGTGVGDKPSDVQFGTCELTCAGLGANECLRCDMQCNTTFHVCEAAPPAPPPIIECQADCECPTGSCVGGQCDLFSTSPRLGVCVDSGGECPCTGGVCDARGCCVLSDGTIETGGGPACNWSSP